MIRRRRIYSELLPPDELGSPATVRLLDAFGLEPIVALAPHQQTPALAHALKRLHQAGVPVSLWPLLEDDDGYWPAEQNTESFVRRVDDVLAFADEANVPVQTIAIDLEPPLNITAALSRGEGLLSVSYRSVRSAFSATRRQKRPTALASLARLQSKLQSRKIETFAAVFPMVVMDLQLKLQPWQYVLQTPAFEPGWDVVSPMLYTTMMASFLPGRSLFAARRLLHRGASALARRNKVGSSVSLGLISPGKLGDEPSFSSPAELGADVEAARAAGIEDLALYALDGVLARGAPEAWLGPFTRP